MSKLGLGKAHQIRHKIIESLGLLQLRDIQPLSQRQIVSSLLNEDYDLELFDNTLWQSAHNRLVIMMELTYVRNAHPKFWYLEDTIALMKTVALYYSFDY